MTAMPVLHFTAWSICVCMSRQPHTPSVSASCSSIVARARDTIAVALAQVCRRELLVEIEGVAEL